VLSEKPDSTKDIWLQPCRVGIEIKLWQPRESEPNYKDDVKKLLNYQKHLQDSFTEEHSFIGIAMLFVHPWEKRKPTDVIEEKAEARCPENGVALHLVTSEGHWRKQY
jgi:hypothetical protein